MELEVKWTVMVSESHRIGLSNSPNYFINANSNLCAARPASKGTGENSCKTVTYTINDPAMLVAGINPKNGAVMRRHPDEPYTSSCDLSIVSHPAIARKTSCK